MSSLGELQKAGREAGSIFDALRNLPDNIEALDEGELQLIGEIAAKTAELDRLLRDMEKIDQPPEVLEKAHARAFDFDQFMQSLTNTTATWGDVGLEAAHGLAGAFTDALVRGESLGDMLRGLAQDVLAMIVRLTTMRAITSLIGGAGGATGTLLGQVAHGGRGPGERGPTRFVDPAIFASAPRLHGGVGPGEMPAIIRDDESVLTPGQMRALGERGGDQFFIDARGADPEQLMRLERMIRDINGSIERRAVFATVSARQRNPRLFG